ncbi:hypothetical protein G9A89_007119 [Geosiphon pyriformis]|nr:hypothetical protein G9A89_007119 [Geosiphon pyriformis]
MQVSVKKSFALNINFIIVADKFFQKKLSYVRKTFFGMNGFGRASVFLKFGGIIWVSFTFEKTIMAMVKLVNDYGIVVNTNFKHPVNNCMNQTIVLKEIPVETFIKAIYITVAEFGIIKSIKIQLIGLWQKVIIELNNQDQADFLAAEWSILIGKDTVQVVRANINKHIWDFKNEFRALLYILFISTTAHNI